MNKLCVAIKIGVLALAVSFLPVAAFKFFGIYINRSHSLVPGVYITQGLTPIQNSVGSAVIIKTDNLPINRKIVPEKRLLKRIYAKEGDLIDYDSNNDCITINSFPLARSKIFSRDKFGDRLPHPDYPYTIKPGEVYLGSEHIHGYDSRYFGAIRYAGNVMDTVTLLWRCR